MTSRVKGARAVDDDAVFRAIADPTRRKMLDMLRDDERTVTDLAEPFEMSQPAVSQHLKVLADAGLVTAERRSRHNVYRLDPEALRVVHAWVSEYERFWTEKLDALGAFLDSLENDSNDTRGKRRR